MRREKLKKLAPKPTQEIPLSDKLLIKMRGGGLSTLKKEEIYQHVRVRSAFTFVNGVPLKWISNAYEKTHTV